MDEQPPPLPPADEQTVAKNGSASGSSSTDLSPDHARRLGVLDAVTGPSKNDNSFLPDDEVVLAHEQAAVPPVEPSTSRFDDVDFDDPGPTSRLEVASMEEDDSGWADFGAAQTSADSTVATVDDWAPDFDDPPSSCTSPPQRVEATPQMVVVTHSADTAHPEPLTPEERGRQCALQSTPALEDDSLWRLDGEPECDSGTALSPPPDLLNRLEDRLNEPVDENDPWGTSHHIWRSVRRPEDARALQIRWPTMRTRRLFFAALGEKPDDEDEPKPQLPPRASTPVQWNETLEPEPATAIPTAGNDAVPAAEFDWTESGMENPLRAAAVSQSSTLLDLDYFGGPGTTTTTANKLGASALEADLQRLGIVGNGSARSANTSPAINDLLNSRNQTQPTRSYREASELSLDARALLSRLPSLDFMLSKGVLFPPLNPDD